MEEPKTALPSASETLRIWAPHLAAMILPLVALAFLRSGPHSWHVALLYILIPGVALQIADRKTGSQRHDPRPELPTRPFDALLCVLVTIQFVNIALLARLFTVQTFWSLDALVSILLVGARSG